MGQQRRRENSGGDARGATFSGVNLATTRLDVVRALLEAGRRLVARGHLDDAAKATRADAIAKAHVVAYRNDALTVLAVITATAIALGVGTYARRVPHAKTETPPVVVAPPL